MFKYHSPDNETPQDHGENKGGVMNNVESIWISDARGKHNRYASSIIINPADYNNLQELFEAVKEHAKRWQRLSNSTIEHIFRYARFMAKHPIFPVDFSNLSYEQFIAHMRYREEIEKVNYGALKHELQTIKVFLRAYGIDERSWFYKLPPKGKTKKRIIPLPPTVYKLINQQYSKDRYENALYQYLVAHSFWIGWRVPSELINMKTNDIDFENNCIYITETKKHGSIRQIYPDEVIIHGKTRKSLKNWLDHWRPKVENQYSGDALYLQPTGKPFTKNHLRLKLSEKCKQIWQHYQPYISRHWNAIAMLIRTKLETGNFDVYTVRNWLGHEEINTTMEYIRYAEQFYRIAGYDWIKATLKTRTGEKGSFYETTVDKNGFGQKPSLWWIRVYRIPYRLYGEILIETCWENKGFDNPLASTIFKPFFSFFYISVDVDQKTFFIFFCFSQTSSTPHFLPTWSTSTIPPPTTGGETMLILFCPECGSNRVRHRLGSKKARCRNCGKYFFPKRMGCKWRKNNN